MSFFLLVALLSLGLGSLCLLFRYGAKRKEQRASIQFGLCGNYHRYVLDGGELRPLLWVELGPDETSCVSVWKRPLILANTLEMLEFTTQFKKSSRQEDWQTMYLTFQSFPRQQKATATGPRPPINRKESLYLSAKHTWQLRVNGSVLWTIEDSTSGETFYWVKTPGKGTED
jgi:hypothetical protein